MEDEQRRISKERGNSTSFLLYVSITPQSLFIYNGKTGNHLTRALNVEHILTAVIHKPIAGNNYNRKLM